VSHVAVYRRGFDVTHLTWSRDIWLSVICRKLAKRAGARSVSALDNAHSVPIR
jgi:hypothetical protein